MKRILVPTDFSQFATRALQCAVQIAARTKAELFIINCVFTPLDWESMSVKRQESYPETLNNTVEAEIKLEKLLNSRLLSNVEVRGRVVHGTPYSKISEIATSQKVDLVVMGSHGNDASGRYFIGSNIQKVMRQASCPVLMVKNDTQPRRWKKLVFASNFEESIEKPFAKILGLARDLEAEIHLLLVNTPGHFLNEKIARERLAKFSERYKEFRMTQVLYSHHELHTGILEYCKSLNADWLAMVTHDRSTSPNYLIGQTETVAFHADIPVLSVRL